MAQPRYTVIIPVAQFDINEPVLASLRENPPPGGMQVIVAAGTHPALQRNAAVNRAEGEILVFLDNDCRPASTFWTELEAAYQRPGVEVVGGPALLQLPATSMELVFHTLLSHSLVVGPVSPRYEAKGIFRPTTQTELILCNLTILKTVFEKIGPLSSDLYPNEENEWLDRAEAAGVGIYYDPELQVFRPQRTTVWEMMRTLARYGIGRTRQLRMSGWRITLHQALPLAVFIPLLAILLKVGFLTMIFLWLAVSAVVAWTSPSELSMEQRMLAGLIAPTFPIAYATGQVMGWWTLTKKDEDEDVSAPVLYDENGTLLG